LPAAILRPTKILASHPVGVFKAWFEALGKGQAIQAATNMALSPVMAADVAQAAVRLVAGGHRGIWHLGASDEMTYLAAARLMAERQLMPPSLVNGEALSDAQVPAIYRHRHATLSSRKIAQALDMPVRRARDVLDTLFAHFPPAVAAPGRRQGGG
jgi:dTDP-4-dehydrorhamnose reductase